MISKELLSELGYGKVTYIGDVIELYKMQCLPFKCEVLRESGRNDGKYRTVSQSYHIAIEVLAYKCKEWAYENDYYVCSIFTFAGEGSCYLTHKDNISKRLKTFDANNEPEAIFKACQWIMDNKD